MVMLRIGQHLLTPRHPVLAVLCVFSICLPVWLLARAPYLHGFEAEQSPRRPQHTIKRLISSGSDITAPRHILVLVKSAPAQRYRERRDNLRHSWLTRCRSGSYFPVTTGEQQQQQRHRSTRTSRVTLTCLFMMGLQNIDAASKAALEREQEVHKDIVLADSLTDVYSTMMVKTIWMLHWATRASTMTGRHLTPSRGGGDAPANGMTHVMLIDDDAFVTLSVFVDWASRLPLTGVYTGHSHLYSVPIFCENVHHANCIWRRDYPQYYYPPYASGFAYLLSRDVAVATVQSALRRAALGPPIPGNNEDAFVGYLVAEGGFELTNEPSFHHYRQDRFACPGQGVPPMVMGNAPIKVLERIARNERQGKINLCDGVGMSVG